MAEEETEEQGDEIAGLGVLASVPGGVMRGVAFILETFRKSSVDLSYAEPWPLWAFPALKRAGLW